MGDEFEVIEGGALLQAARRQRPSFRGKLGKVLVSTSRNPSGTRPP